jgi:thymidylate synthase (FAD)
MKIIKQSYEILVPSTNCERGTGEGGLSNKKFIQEARLIEQAGRTAYKSENKISDTSYDAFIRGIIERKHEAVIEFGSMMVKFITNRGVSHELVRHRLCSFVQESTRYCNYGKDKFGNEITIIEPVTWSEYSKDDKRAWFDAMEFAEKNISTSLMMAEVPSKPAALCRMT